MTYDVAVLTCSTADLRSNFAGVAAVEIADGYSVADSTFAIGNPESEGLSVTQGIVSVESEEIELDLPDGSDKGAYRVMRIDTAINGGNSGGGLFNVEGKLIGLVNAKNVDSAIDNIAYALPYDNITKVADNLIYYYTLSSNISHSPSSIKQLWLGVTLSVENSHAVYNSESNTITIYDDFKINNVEDNSFAKSTGLKAGDIITKFTINGVEYDITRTFVLRDLLITVRAGDIVVFTINRKGETRTLTRTVLSSNLVTKK